MGCKQGSKTTKQISEYVSIKKQVMPDTISVTMNLQGCFETKEQCVSEYNKALSEIYNAVEKLNLSSVDFDVEPLNITSYSKQIYRQWNVPGSWRPIDLEQEFEYFVKEDLFIGYEYDQEVRFTTPFKEGSDIAERIWQALGFMECVDEFDLKFILMDKGSCKQELIDEIVALAKKQAKRYGSACGNKLGDCLYIEPEKVRTYDKTMYEGSALKILPEHAATNSESTISVPTLLPTPATVSLGANIKWAYK